MTRARTAGDGMESAINTAESIRNSDTKVHGRPSKDSLLPGRLVQVYPTNFIKPEKKTLQMYAKNPKFVPYEPYPAAVKPMIPQTATRGLKKTVSKNNMDINTLITQMSQMDTTVPEYKPRAKLTSVTSVNEDVSKPSPENIEMQKQIDRLAQENESLKEQLKQQAQVSTDRILRN